MAYYREDSPFYIKNTPLGGVFFVALETTF